MRVNRNSKITEREFYESAQELRQAVEKSGCDRVPDQTATVSASDDKTAAAQGYWEKAVAAVIP